MAKYVRVVKYDEYYTGEDNEGIVRGAVGKIYKCLSKQYLGKLGLHYLIYITGANTKVWIQADHCEDITKEYIDRILEETKF